MRPVKLLDWYIIRKFLGTYLFILGIFCVIIVVIDVSEKIDDFLTSKPPFRLLIMQYYVNFLFFFGNMLTPLCVFLAVIFFTSRLAQNTEIIAVLASGVSFYRLMMPYVFSALLIGGVSFYLNAYLVPTANGQRMQFQVKYIDKEKPMKDNNIHRKIASDKAEQSESFVYFFSFNQLINEGYIFSMEKIVKSDLVAKINCEKVTWDPVNQKWKLQNCYQRTMNSTKESLVFRSEIDTTFLLKPDDIYVREMKAESMPLDDLYRYIELEKMRGSDILEELILEKYERYAYPFAALVLTLIGYAVSTQKRRGGTALQLGIGLVISFVFVVLVMVGQAIVGDNVPAWVGVWYPNVLFFLIGIVLLRLAPK